MKLFGYDTHRHRDPWEGSPPWAVEIGVAQAIIIMQNEAILAKLEDRPAKLSPEDQAKLNKIFDRATASTAKVDTELPKA